jgi:type IV secretory pathway VirB10-like protein
MIQELVVTSAPRGLQAGRSGFTTVLRTRGMHPDLAARLEAASAYRHVHPQGDPRNPIIYCYVARQSAVGEAWVMSRIGDAGTDYTGRSNKIAHHVALQAADLATVSASNPAAVMAALAAAGGLLAQWSGEPREHPASPTLPLPPSNPGMCQRWAAVAGDAGWAGVIVERALNREPTWVIAPAGCDLLALYAEALALVSPGQRWQIPFTTYSLRGDEGRWLGTTAGSPEAVAAQGQNRILVVDLTRRGPAAGAGPYVLAARGLTPVPWQRSAAPAVATRPGVPMPQPPVGFGSPTPATGPSGLPGSLMLGMPPRPRPSVGPKGADDGEWEEIPIDQPRTGRLALLLSIGALVIVGVGAGAYFGFQSLWTTDEPAQVNDATDPLNDKKPQADPKTLAGSGTPSGNGHGNKPQQDEVVPDLMPAPPDNLVKTVPGAAPPSPPSEARDSKEPPLSAASAKEPAAPKPEDPKDLANKAFEKLKKDLEDRRHLPVEGLKPDDPNSFANLKFVAQSVVLCDVGKAEIDVELPTEAFQFALNATYRLRAEFVGDSNPGARAWAIRADLEPPSSQDVPPDPVPKTVALGRVLHQDASLRLELDAQAVQQPDMVVIAKIRQGLITAVLKIINRQDPGQTTWVQLYTPAENPRVVMEKFFFDKDLYPAKPKQGPKRTVGMFDVPFTPWPQQLRLKAMAAGAKGDVVDREPGAVVGKQDDASPSFTIRWSAESGDELFLETTFEIDTDVSSRVLRLIKAELKGEWATHRQLRPIADADDEKFVFSGIKDKKDFEDDDLLKVRQSAVLALARSVAKSHKDVFDKIQGKCKELFSSDIGRDWVGDQRPLTGGKPDDPCWRLALLRMLAKTGGYQEWLSSKHPRPKHGPPPQSPKELEAWEKNRREKESQWNELMVPKMDAVSKDDFPKFWTSLQDMKAAITPEKKKTQFSYLLEALICLLIEELEPLDREKRKALALIESLGDGTVSLEGDVAIGFPSAGATSVLGRFGTAGNDAPTDAVPPKD